jgi:hypothetical protein
VYICLITKYNYNSGLLAVPYCHYIDIKPCIGFTSVSFRCKGFIFQYSFKAKWIDLLGKSVEMAKIFFTKVQKFDVNTLWCQTCCETLFENCVLAFVDHINS